MKYLLVIILCLIPFIGNTTETIKISELGTGTAVTDDDYLVYVDDPGGNPVTKKITGENFKLSLGITDLLSSYVPLSTFTAAGDVPVGSASGAVTVIPKGDNNTFFGVNNAGTLGFHSSFNPVFVAAPVSDDTYSGTVASFVAGENLTQWDVVYCKNKSGVHACYKYDANGADKALPPRAMATAAISADASGTFLLTGIVRNDGWSQTTNQDEGKIVYADGGTAGAITLTKSTTTADMIAIVGYVVEQNVVYFNPSPILVEVP